MRIFLSVIALLGILSGVQAQEPENTPLYLGSGVRVEYHPNNFPEYKRYAPKASEVCAPGDMGNSCGRVWWNSHQQPVVGKKYVTQVPAVVRLRGRGKDVWWSPFVHCMVKDAEQKLQSTSPPGVQCVTVHKQAEERMEWAIGGIVEGIDHAIPDTYTGIIPLTVTGPLVARWKLDIPVAYTVHRRQQECGLRIVDPGQRRFSFDRVRRGFRSTRHESVFFQVQSEEPYSSWEVSVMTLGPTTPGPTFALKGTPDPSSGTSSPGWQNVKILFDASDMWSLPPGDYDHRWKVSVMCSE